NLVLVLCALHFILCRYIHHSVLLSFPTRRSSDLYRLSSLLTANLPHAWSIVVMDCWLSRFTFEHFPAKLVLGSPRCQLFGRVAEDRKSTLLNSSHVSISYAVFCLKNNI